MTLVMAALPAFGRFQSFPKSGKAGKTANKQKMLLIPTEINLPHI